MTSLRGSPRGSRVFRRSAAALGLLAGALLGGCSTTVGELQFPAVHDMPPARADTMLSSDEQKKAQQDLVTARDSIEQRVQQNAQNGAQPAVAAAPAATGSIPTKSASAAKPGG